VAWNLIVNKRHLSNRWWRRWRWRRRKHRGVRDSRDKRVRRNIARPEGQLGLGLRGGRVKLPGRERRKLALSEMDVTGRGDVHCISVLGAEGGLCCTPLGRVVGDWQLSGL
jgi:hypothetical protein